MRRKFTIFGIICIVLALAVFALSYGMFHYLTDAGFTTQWQPEAGKPFVTEMVGNLGVMLLGSGILSLLAGKIFFPEKTK